MHGVKSITSKTIKRWPSEQTFPAADLLMKSAAEVRVVSEMDCKVRNSLQPFTAIAENSGFRNVKYCAFVFSGYSIST